jgi:NitT/TauT family transport system permease protein
VGEFVGSEAGLGFVIMAAQGTLDTPVMVMSLILVTLVGVTLYGLVVALERLVVTEDARLR